MNIYLQIVIGVILFLIGLHWFQILGILVSLAGLSIILREDRVGLSIEGGEPFFYFSKKGSKVVGVLVLVIGLLA